MSRRSIADGSRAYVVAIDEGFPVAERWSALAVGLAIDEEREQPAAVPMKGWTDRVGVTVTARAMAPSRWSRAPGLRVLRCAQPLTRSR